MKMGKVNRRPGQNIRELALKRRVKAILFFVNAGLVVVLPLYLIKVFQDFVSQIPSSNSPQSSASFNVPFIFYIFLLVAALSLVVNSVLLWQKADRADQGARGEEEIGDEVCKLEPLGWQIEYGMRLGGRLGDADIVCISPQNKAYVVDVKSHQGDVILQEEKLYRKMGKETYPFEKDFLKQAMKQAFQVKKQKRLSFVTPIVAFSNARVLTPAGKIQGVYVVERLRLVTLLKKLG